MARKRAAHGPTDHLLALLYGVISSPSQIDTTKPDFNFSLRMVVRPDHRQFLGDTFGEIEASIHSPQELTRIKEGIIKWQDREFPVR
jgi:hypothetical protein